MKNHHHNFIDKCSGKTVYNAECECGKKWMVDSLLPFGGFRVMREQDTMESAATVA
jgi:hypothetical protein